MTTEHSNTGAASAASATNAPAPIGVTHFRDYVRSLPHQWIFDHLISGSGGSRRILSSAMVKEAEAKFVAKASLARRFKALAPQLKLRCAQVYLMGGNGLSLSEPAAYAREPLLESLLVFAAQNGAGVGGARLFGFDEFEPALRPLMAEALAGWGMASECAPPAAVCPWRPLNDVTAVCSLALHGQLRRSVHGGLSRSALNTLKRLVHDPTLTGKSVSEGEPGHPAGFLIGFCLSEGLIADAGAEYALNRRKFGAWLERSMRERLHRAAAYASEFLGGFGLELLRELLERSEGHWVPVASLVPEADRPALARALSVFEFLGRVHTGHHHGGASGGVRFTPHRFAEGDPDRLYAKEPKRDTVVMSDFSVVIPQEVSPSELFDFSKIGQLAEFDKVYRGQITKESVSNALSVGVDAAYVREWLRARHAPANVVKTADEWMREFSRLFVSHGSTLVSGSEKVTRQIASLEPLRRHLVEMGAHTVFRIRPGSEQKVLDMLEKLGFDTRAPGAEADADGSGAGARHAQYAADAAGSEDAPPGAGGGAPAGKKRWKPLTDFTAIPETPALPMKRTKYGAGLKPLEINEMIHVVDYALLTNQSLVIDYAGSANIKQSIYTVTPVNIDKGIDAAVEAEIPYVRGRKQFYLNRIKRIGVVAQ